MKTKTYIVVCSAMLSFCSGIARAQDSSPVQDTNPDAGSALDATVHAGVDEKAAQPPQARQQPNKRPAPYTRWAFQSANHPPTTRVRPAQTTGLLPAQSETGDTPSTLFNPLTRSEIPPADSRHHGPDTPFRISPMAGAPDPSDPHSAAVRAMLQNLDSQNETSTQDLKARNPVRSPYPRNNNSFPAPVREKKIKPAENTLFPSPFLKSGVSNSTLLKPKPRKHDPVKPVGGSKQTSSPSSQLPKQN